MLEDINFHQLRRVGVLELECWREGLISSLSILQYSITPRSKVSRVFDKLQFPDVPIFHAADLKSKYGKLYIHEKKQKGDAQGNHADDHGADAGILNIAENGDDASQD